MKAEPFDVAIPEAELQELRNRLARTRWTDDLDNADWRYGVERHWLEDMVRYWGQDYDWRAVEREINRLGNYKVTIDGVPTHFVHVRGRGPCPTPSLLVHGWPWTFMDFQALIGPLSDPAAHGGDPADAFDVIVPSLPGFGFSTPLAKNGYAMRQLGELFHKLMTETLGYPRYAVAGGDFGAAIVGQMAHAYPEQVFGMLATIPIIPGDEMMDIKPEQYAPDEQWMITRRAETYPSIISHLTVHSIDPQTLAYGLVDSPVGTAAWLWERRRAWNDCGGDLLSVHSRDFLCTLASIYWLTRTIGTSLRIYWEIAKAGSPTKPLHDRKPAVTVPTAFAIHHRETIVVPRSIPAASTNLQRWSLMPRGGHFGFSEQPQGMIEELRAFFHPLRASER